MIPKILHYVWVGGPLPDLQKAYIDTWRQTNPDFEIVCWNEKNIDMSAPIISRAYARRKWAKVADVARLQGVLKLGGIYLDTDFKLFKSLEPLCKHACFYAFQESSPSADWVCNGAFGAEPNHWFVKRALDGLYDMREHRILPERPTNYGPKHITRLLTECGLSTYSDDGVLVKDIYLAPVETFFPFHFTDEFSDACVTDRTLGAHFWEKSWESTIPAPIRLASKYVRHARKFKRMLAAAR